MFEQAVARESRSPIVDWCLRGGVAAAFMIFGCEKFPSGAGEFWVKFFQQLGFGQWFRYFTGVVEILGGLLLLVPRMAMVGLALLICTMASAAALWIFRMGQPGNSVICILFTLGLTAFAMSRR